MKKLLPLIVLFLVVASAVAAPYRSYVVTTATLTINVAAGNFIVIRNFTQEGGTVRGVVTATLTTSTGATTTANVLNAAMIDNTAAAVPSPTPANAIAQPETINVVTIAGPATITVPPVAGAQLFITLQKLSQPD